MLWMQPSCGGEWVFQRLKCLAAHVSTLVRYVTSLIDLLHDELVRCGKEQREVKIDRGQVPGNVENGHLDAYVTDDFCLEVDSTRVCRSCNYSRTTRETFRNLSVEITVGPDGEMGCIASSLRQHFEKQVVECRCEECGDGTQADKYHEIVKL